MIDKIVFSLLAIIFAGMALVYFSPNYILIETDNRGNVVGSATIFPIGKEACRLHIQDLDALGPRNTKMTCVLIKTHKIDETENR